MPVVTVVAVGILTFTVAVWFGVRVAVAGVNAQGPAFAGNPAQANVTVPENAPFALTLNDVVPVSPAETVDGEIAARAPIAKSGGTVTSKDADALAGCEFGDDAVIVNA